eukprot:TRINITY_DN297_c0_g1_i3.p1 TRINITY_DN297_c0_g1~~TRINITY_DN297_c0_g1_i3.p1  ORF type:complete len:1036 (+),score=201.22 TRINITY_DN297_c0_g1_i3:1018-4125(+)
MLMWGSKKQRKDLSHLMMCDWLHRHAVQCTKACRSWVRKIRHFNSKTSVLFISIGICGCGGWVSWNEKTKEGKIPNQSSQSINQCPPLTITNHMRRTSERHIERRVPWWTRPGHKLDISLHTFFFRHALRILDNPIKWFAGFFVVSFLIAVPAASLVINASPQLSGISDETISIVSMDVFGYDQRFDVILGDVNGGNLLSKNQMEKVCSFQNKLVSSNFSTNIGVLPFDSFCQPVNQTHDFVWDTSPRLPISEKDHYACKIASICGVGKLALHNLNANLKNNRGKVALQNGMIVPFDQIAGGVTYDTNSGNVTSVKFWRLMLFMQNSPVSIPDSVFVVRPTETTFFDVIRGMRSFADEWNMGESINAVVDSPWTVEFVSYFQMFFVSGSLCVAYVYTMGLGIKYSSAMVYCVGATSGVFGAAIGITCLLAMGTNLAGWNLIAMVTVVFIAVDDVFVIISAIRFSKGNTIEERICAGVAESATAISMTTLTDVLVFGAAAFSPVPILSHYGIIVGTGVAIDFVLQLHFVIPAMYYNMLFDSQGKRICHDARVKRGTTYHVSDVETATMDHSVSKKRKVTVTTIQVRESEGSVIQSIPASTTTSVYSSRSTDDHGEDVEEMVVFPQSKIRSWFANHFATFIQTKLGIAIGGGVGLVLVGITVYTLLTLNPQVITENLLGPPETQETRAAKLQFSQFPNSEENLYIYMGESVPLWNADVQNKLLSVMNGYNDLPSNISVAEWTPRCWLSSFLSSMNGTIATTEKDFMGSVAQFVDRHPVFKQDVMWMTSDRRRMKGSRCVFAVVRAHNVTAGLQGIRAVEQHMLSKGGSLRNVGWANQMWMMAESTEYQRESLYGVGGICVLAVIGASCLFLVNPWTSVFVGLAMVIPAAVSFAFVEFSFGISTRVMNMNLMLLGFGVDYVAHVIHKFNTSPGNTDMRLRTMFRHLSQVIIISTGMAIVPLTIAVVLQAALSIVFYCITVTMVIAMIVALVVVPVILQFVTPPPVLRDVELQHKLETKKARILDQVWKDQFEKRNETS